ncbi:MAG: hypothetical protein ACRDOE_07250 [Streptosporangiaceae bacterium]
MVAYCWPVLPADTSQIPARLGVTGDREQAQKTAGLILLRDAGAFLALAGAVRPALRAPGLASCYQRTGESWTGRRARGGRVHWTGHRRT